MDAHLGEGPKAAQPAATQLIDLPHDVLFQLLQRVTASGTATLRTLAATCHPLLEASLLYEPSISAKWQQSARNAPLLPAYMRATLLARNSPLRLVITKVAISNDAGRFAIAVAKGLGVCKAVQHLSLREACPFASIQQWPLACTDDLATNYPGLTQLNLQNLTLPAPALHSLLSHPQLSQRLRQLSLDQVTLVQGDSTWQDTMFNGSQLHQLSLASVHTLPCLAPLALYLVRFSLYLHYQTNVVEALATLRPPPQLRVLELDGPDRQLGLSQPGLQKLLQDLPNLQELVTPWLVVSGMQTLDTLLAATELTRLSVQAVTGVTESRARAKCSWRLLELRFGNKKNICLNWVSAAHLPLCSLTQPLSVCYMCTSLQLPPAAALEALAAAVHNMAACCGQEVQIQRLDLEAENMPIAPLQQPIAPLQPAPHPSQVPLPEAGLQPARPLSATLTPQRASAVVHQLALWKPAVVHVRVAHLPSLTVSSLQALASVCHKTKVLSFACGALELHLEFWTALQQLMPSVECVNLWEVQCDGAALMEGLGQLSNQVGVRPLTVQLGAGTGKGVCNQKTVLGVITVLPGDSAESQES
ncbi:hypothetical protein QJQ45_002581 [Haematococcus lacustris]|nr:hypothetical protein QJQ45_002581 [Haematococcus lacustris]